MLVTILVCYSSYSTNDNDRKPYVMDLRHQYTHARVIRSSAKARSTSEPRPPLFPYHKLYASPDARQNVIDFRELSRPCRSLDQVTERCQ